MKRKIRKIKRTGYFLLASLFFLVSSSAFAQDAQIKGTVVDQVTDEPLIGVSILVKGTTTSTSTDENGQFAINAARNEVLVLTYIGYKTQEVVIGNRDVVPISMEQDLAQLDEVVVIGYGSRNRTAVTNSVSRLENEKLDQVPSGRVETALAGRISGVNISNARNTPGTAPEIRIRGLGSISAGNDPLVVIDGFPGGNLGQLNMNDVQSVEVLKDASSTAIYGSRGAGGVILVTTKRGATGNAKLNLNSYYGFADPIVPNDWLTGQEWYDYLTRYQNREFVWNGGDPTIPIWGDPERPRSYQVDPLAMTLPQTVWQDEILQVAPIQNHNLSVSGGNERSKYYVSGTFADEKGAVKTAAYRQYAVRANVDIKVNDVVSMGVEVSPSYNRRRTAGSSMGSLSKYPPFVSPNKLNGKYPRTYDYISTGHSGQASPYTFLYGTENYTSSFTNIGQAFVNLQLMEGLSFKTSLGTNIAYTSSNYWSGGIGDPQVNTNGNAAESHSFNIVNENVLSYNKTLGEDHSVGGILGASYQNATSRSSRLTAVANSFNNDIIKTLNNAQINPLSTTQTASEWGLVSYFVRANYAYKNKYLIEGSFRRDGSSRFGPDSKWGDFPSASIAWRVAEEDFMDAIPSISELKLRASVGVTGNFNIGDFPYLGAVSIVHYSPADETVNAIAQSTVANPTLSWEKTKGYNLGLDLGLFESRLNFIFDYYDNQTTGMLYNVNTPAITGFSSKIINGGGVKNKGIDLEISSKNMVGEFKWNSSFNFSHNINEVTDLVGGVTERTNSYGTYIDFLLRKGEPMFSFYGYKIKGIFDNAAEIESLPHLAGTKPGNPILQDTNDDGKITPEDRVILGNFQPDFLLGMTHDFSYKGFDLSIFMNASLGAEIYNIESQYYQGNTLGAMRRSLVENQWWSEEEPGDGMTPAASLSQLFGYNSATDYYVENASYFTIRNVNLGYTFADIAKKNWGVKSLRLYTSVNNLLVVKSKDNHSYNPEGTTQGEVSGINSVPGVNYGSEPITRTIVFGVNIGF